MVVVDHGHLEVGLVQDDGRGVGIPGVGRMRGHVVDGQTLRHVNPEVMSPGNYILVTLQPAVFVDVMVFCAYHSGI